MKTLSSSSANTQSGAVSKDNRIDGPVDRKTIISHLKGLLWILFNIPVRMFMVLKESALYLFNNIRATISKEKESCKYEAMKSWRKTCVEFRSSATEARLMAMNRGEGERNYRDEVKALVDDMNYNMERVESMDVKLHGTIELSPVMFETMLQQIKKGSVIDEKLLNDTRSFVDVFNRYLEAIEKKHRVERLLFLTVMWCKLALYIFKNEDIVDKNKTERLILWFYLDLGVNLYYLDINEQTETRVPKSYERFSLFIKCWQLHCRSAFQCYGLIEQLRKEGISNIPDSWDSPDLLMRLIMKHMDRLYSDPDKDDASFNADLKEWEKFTQKLALSKNKKTDERIKDVCRLLEPYIDRDKSKLLL